MLQERKLRVVLLSHSGKISITCIVCQRLISLVYRGTASKKQMEDNLNYSRLPIDFHDLAIPALDHVDGLNFKPMPADEDFELDSVSDDEADLMIDDEFDDDDYGPPSKKKKGVIGRIIKEQDVEHENSRETAMEVSRLTAFAHCINYKCISV